jgi:uncharacterized protein YndB with AHSA1/START domain
METLTKPALDEASVLITRIIGAPRAAVFKAWTEQESLLHWYAPTGCRISFAKLDACPGGEFHSCILTPDGHECWCRGVYREVVAPELIVHTMAIADAEGRQLNAVEAGMDPEWPNETVLTVRFEEHEGKTKVTLHQTVSESLAKRTGAHPSWLQMLDRLAELLEQ